LALSRICCSRAYQPVCFPFSVEAAARMHLNALDSLQTQCIPSRQRRAKAKQSAMPATNFMFGSGNAFEVHSADAAAAGAPSLPAFS